MSEKSPSQTVGSEDDSRRSMFLSDYTDQIEETDKLPEDDLRPVLLGLFGEVGSVMATAKKYHREKNAYSRYRDDLTEELGDVLWYFAALCRRLGYGIDEIFSDAANGENYKEEVAASDLPAGPLSRVAVAENIHSLDELLLELGQATSALLGVEEKGEEEALSLLRTFADRYLRTVQAKGVTFAEIVFGNAEKSRGRFLEFDPADLLNFDDDFPEDEKLPEEFRIEITQRKSGRSYMRWKDVFIGDPLTDNMINEDGYRFHDVFHLSYAAILHWSPIFRGLIKHKRKSSPEIDEAEDGGRARVVEEGVSAWIFSQAKELDFFEGQKSISFGLLKGVQNFVKGYEVEKCPLRLWERAILEGYKVFRQVKKNEGGIVIGNLKNGTISYEPLPKPKSES